jgi:hypothetical protein
MGGGDNIKMDYRKMRRKSGDGIELVEGGVQWRVTVNGNFLTG